jgi:hypothetical protein
MPDSQNAPPEREEPGPTPETGPNQKSVDATTNHTNLNADARQCVFDTMAGLRRRRTAAQRVAPLDCGCRDPWPCRCTQPAMSENALDGWAAAARHVLSQGRTPMLPLEVRRALWHRPGDRALAVALHEACGGAPA